MKKIFCYFTTLVICLQLIPYLHGSIRTNTLDSGSDFELKQFNVTGVLECSPRDNDTEETQGEKDHFTIDLDEEYAIIFNNRKSSPRYLKLDEAYYEENGMQTNYFVFKQISEDYEDGSDEELAEIYLYLQDSPDPILQTINRSSALEGRGYGLMRNIVLFGSYRKAREGHLVICRGQIEILN